MIILLTLSIFLVEVVDVENFYQTLRTYQIDIYLLKVNNRKIRKRCGICSQKNTKVNKKPPKRRQRRRSGVFIATFDYILHLLLAFLLLTLSW